MPVKLVEVKGNTLISDEKVINNANITDKTKLFALSSSKLKKNLEELPMIESVKISDTSNTTVLRKLIKYYNEATEVTEFIKNVIYKFEPKADKMIEDKNDELANKMFEISSDPNRSLFSEETTKKILSHITEETTSNVSE